MFNFIVWLAIDICYRKMLILIIGEWDGLESR